jgi:hypothetical protein
MTTLEKHMVDENIENFLATIKEAGERIDPETAEVDWRYVDPGDPYGVDPLPKEYRSVGRGYFARSPGSSIWVSFDDLPTEICDTLREKHRHSQRKYNRTPA